MKKILYILLAIIMAACTHEDIATMQPNEGEAINLTFSVNVPEMGAASRAFGETATINNLTLYVFDESGYYLYAAEATLLDSESDHLNVPADSQTEKQFKVTLKQSSSKRIIHFVANYTSEALTFEAEQVLMAKMAVSGTNDAYWQRMEFEGISENTTMTKIPLVRNFAKVAVDVTATNFELIRFAVVNKPTSGTIAAYNSSKGSFATYTDASTYTTVSEQGYRGSMPSNVGFASTGSDTDPYQFTGATNTPIYLYERKQPSDETYTFLLVYGKYKYSDGSDANGYYKIDLVDNQANAYNILRNFEYKVTITEVVSAGKTSAAAAAAGSANNIVSNTTTQNLLNVSDGVSRLYVSFTDTTLVNTDAIQLKYKYIPQVSSGTSNNGAVEITFISSTGVGSTTPQGDVIDEYSLATSDVTGGWRTITIIPNSPSTVSKHQTIRIKGGALIREVDLHLVEQLNMGLSCNPTEVNYAINQDVDVIMTLPADIPQMYFPLIFKIEAEKLSIYPDSEEDYMPLEVGASIVPSKNKAQSYYFTKTLEYSDYSTDLNSDGTYTLTSHFLTNKEASGSTIYVYNEYFGINSTSFTHKEPITVYIPAGNITAQGNYIATTYNRTWEIYTDSNFTNSIGTCTFTRTNTGSFMRPNYKYSLNALTLNIPKDVDILYFACTYNNNTYYTSMSVTEIKEAQNNPGKVLQIDYIK